MRFAYILDKKIHISEYTDDMHGQIFCAEGHPLLARRGQKNIHHFAHKTSVSCSCSDNKGDWHISWQDRAIKDAQEIRITYNNTLHIADTLVPKIMVESCHTNGYVIEYQHSSMTEKVMREREYFYTQCGYHLVWVFDTSLWEIQQVRRISGIDDTDMTSPSYKPTIITYRKTRGSDFPLYGTYTGQVTKIFDFNKNSLFVVTEQKNKIITGYILSLEDFDRKYLGKCSSPNNELRPFHHPH